MKKILFFMVGLVLLSCSQISYKSPHEKRNLTIINTIGRNIDIIVKARYNSVVYFNGTLNMGQSIPLNNVPLCILIPEQGYDWRVEKTDDHSDNPVWRIRSVTDDEKLKVMVWNTNLNTPVKLKYRVKVSGTAFETTDSIPIGTAVLIKLYDADYEFELDGAGSPPANQEFNITYDKAAQKITISQLPKE